jgi:hypothetical protein
MREESYLTNAVVTMPRTISGLLHKNKIPVDHPDLRGYFFKWELRSTEALKQPILEESISNPVHHDA